MILVPTACGLEVAGEKTWNFWVFDDSTSYAVTSKSNADRTFNISFRPGTGNPFVCVTGGYRFMQGINTFDLSTSHSVLYDDEYIHKIHTKKGAAPAAPSNRY